MISSLDYLDYDVSNVLSEYINIRRNHDNVIQDIEQLININICSQYLKSFDALRGAPGALSSIFILKGQNRRLEHANYLLTSDRKTNLLHNWPTKYPDFYRQPFRLVITGPYPSHSVLRANSWEADHSTQLLDCADMMPFQTQGGELWAHACCKTRGALGGRDTLIRVSNEDYIIRETNWRLKKFPPDKNKYSINQLLMLK